jgi:hypothetical protein
MLGSATRTTAQGEDPFENVRTVIVDRNSVYVALVNDRAKHNFRLVSRVDDCAFVKAEIGADPKEVDALPSPENFQTSAFASTQQPEGTAAKVYVNALEDWCVKASKTLQIEVLSTAPFTMQFDNSVELKGAKGQISFTARLAAHRARANLVVEFYDPTKNIWTARRVSFDRNYVGGTDVAGYQDVRVDAPEGLKSLTVRVSIEFLGSADDSQDSNPFLFVADAILTEPHNDKMSSKVLAEQAGPNRIWLVATSKLDLNKMECVFIESDGYIKVVQTDQVSNARAFFDETYYEEQNSEVDFSHIDSFTHYLRYGRFEYRNPGPEVSVREYLLRHPDVAAAQIDPLVHYANEGQKQSRSLGTFNEKIQEIWAQHLVPIPDVEANLLMQRAQDHLFPMELVKTKKLAVFVVPEYDAMSGGIYSMFSIAHQVRLGRISHGFDVVVMTRPNAGRNTYIRNSAFRNSETVLRFDQLPLFTEVSELQLHIPEYATVEFARYLTPNTLNYLMGRDHIHVNILNQNTRLMPEAAQFRDLRRIANTIGQSVSHHAFFGPEWAKRYDLPTLLLPAYTDLTMYPPSKFEEKENLIIYSADEAPYRAEVLNRLKSMGDYKLVKIQDISFDKYMELATRCRFSVSFGEGFDGYVAQPMYQGGIGFALYNEEFFPDKSYSSFQNFFKSEDDMIENIVPTIRRLESDQKAYVELNKGLRAKWDELYDFEDYRRRINMLIRKKYEIIP